MEKRLIMKRILPGIITTLIICSFISGQRSKRNKSLSNVGSYSLLEFSRAISKDSILVTAFVDIPFRSLQFIKKNNSFFASYDVSIILKNNKGKRIFRKMWTDSIRTDDYIQTQSRLRTRKHFSNFTVAKNKYEIESELYDKDTRNKGSKNIKIDFSKLTKTPSLMDPIIITDLEGEWGFDVNEFPITGKSITSIDKGLSLIISGFIDNKPYEVLGFMEGLKEDGKDIIIKKDTSDGFFNHRYKLNKSILSTMGLEIGIKLIQSKKESEVIKKISIYKPGLSGFVNNVENSFEQMRYILTNNERKEAKGKKGKALEKIFLDFWNKRDPTPETNINELMEEYYIRVNYVNEYFNMSWKEGWETDFGMIYILFGPPDEIQRSNATSANTSVYQAWYYNRLNKQFVFRDQNGFGDFKLDKPFIGPNF